ncbi:oxygenase MpaB family protein [Granulosicoccus sp. 3-233]|uniref:oxygenase MpaB family protein n=1 Tax=Granulosicoccus sp. 3-233 TaxID=3417969 RepID=UPI003D34C01D
MSRWAREIETLDPQVDHERICFILHTCEFSWDIEKALEFALFRTYAVPSISGLLSSTGEFRDRTRKRYDDTELLLSEISENGQSSERGQAAIERINDMHGRYRIANDDMLYVLSTFVVEPVHWLARFGKRAMTPREIDACVHYYRALAARMHIKEIPDSFAEFEAFHRDHEAARFRYARSNAEIGCLTRDMLLSLYLPRCLVPLGRPAVHALCDPPLRSAMGFAQAPRWVECLVLAGLGIRARILRLIPARRRPRLITRRRRSTYPTGYRISDLGTFR